MSLNNQIKCSIMKFNIKTIREDNYLMPSSLQAVKGGVALPQCSNNSCGRNTGKCDENSCLVNSLSCGVHNCGSRCESNNLGCNSNSCTSLCKMLSVGG